MSSNVRPVGASVALVLGMALALYPFLGQAHVNVDELDDVSEAFRLVHGQMIYVDFFEFKPPLPYALVATLLKLGGPGVLWPRVLQALGLLAAGLACYGTARLAGVRRWLAVLPGLVLATALFPRFPVFYHHWLALAFTAGAMGCAALATARDRLWASAGAGLLVGLAGLCTQTDGVVGALALAAAVALGPFPLRRRLAHAAAGAGACMLPLAIAAGILAALGALGPAWYHMVVWPRQHYRTAGGTNDVAFGSDLAGHLQAAWRTPFLPARLYHLAATYACWPVLAGVALLLLVRRRPWAPVERVVALMAFATMAACLVGRADYAHLAMYACLPLLLAVLWCERFGPRAGLLLALYALAGVALTAERAMVFPGIFRAPWQVDAALAELPLNQYVRRVCQPDDRVVGVPSSALTSLYGRPNPTPFTLIYPPAMGYNSAAQYASFWRAVQLTRPKLIVFLSTGDLPGTLAFYAPPPLPGYRSGPDLITPLDDRPTHAYVFERVDEGAKGAARSR